MREQRDAAECEVFVCGERRDSEIKLAQRALSRYILAPEILWGSSCGLHTGEVAADFAGDQQTCGRGHKWRTARDVPAIRAFARGSGRADAVCAATDGHVLNRAGRLFRGEDNLELFYPALAHLVAHHLCERIHRGLVDVGDLQLRGIELIARTHTADHRYAGFFGLHDDFYLGGDRIYTVYDIIVLREIKLIRGFREKKALVHRDIGVRVDVQDPLLCHIYLVLSDSPPCGDELTVYICEAYLVVVYQVYGSETRADKPLHDISSDSSDSEYNDPGILHFLYTVFTQKKLGA